MRKYREASTVKEIQKSILTYIESNKYSASLLKIAGVMALVAPIYMVVSRIYFLHSVGNIIEIFYAILYIAYYAGTIMCFAKDDMIPLSIAYGFMAVNSICNLTYGISLNRIVYLVFYAFLAGICIKAAIENSQLDHAKETILQNGTKYAENVKTAFSDKTENEIRYCPMCGAKCSKDMKFCCKCGHSMEG